MRRKAIGIWWCK